MKKRKNTRSKAVLGAMGAAIIIGIYCAAALAMTGFAFGNENGTREVGFFSLLALMIAGGLGTFISAKALKLSTPISALSPAAVVLVLYTALALILTGGKVGLSHAMNMVCFLMISVLFAFLSAPRAKRVGARRR